MLIKKYNVIVIGGGHAGIEAAGASARMGSNTLLITHNIETIGQMSCNPAIGGIGKGHLVKEIDALDGIMAKAIDRAGIQFRILNLSKGPAVQATRAQADKILYKIAIKQILENQKNLSIFQDSVNELIVENNEIKGIITNIGLKILAQSVIVTTGTFLNGLIYIGDKTYPGGRAGESPSTYLANNLRSLPLDIRRLKTGTPPRINKNSIDFSCMLEQKSDLPVPVFSFLGDPSEHPAQASCYITHTNDKTHAIILNNINKSAMYSGAIKSVGPRYCPSIEDKIVKFANKNSHQIFVEPEGLTSNEIYPNGISTSLPYDVQEKFIRTIKGFENAVITRAAYAIEYDYCDPQDLNFNLETKAIKGLFLAGQINGTTGYEEAGAQGLLAGINASLRIQNKDPWWPKRDEAYLGVLIDDLITKGITEPYRMFTSRAEFRLLLREDNADLRLTPIGYKLGCVSDLRWQSFTQKQEHIQLEIARLKDCWILPETATGTHFEAQFNQKLSKEQSLYDLLKRPEISYSNLMQIEKLGPGIDIKIASQIELQAKYAGYISRQQIEVERVKKHENFQIPFNIDYQKIPGLSKEVIEKLEKIKPETLGQASRISGLTPASISLILIYSKKIKYSSR